MKSDFIGLRVISFYANGLFKSHSFNGINMFYVIHLHFTAATKINRPGHNIRMYWTSFWQPTVHVQKTFLKKTLIEVCSPHLYASFETFCIQIGQLVATQWDFKHSKEFWNRGHFPSIAVICRFPNILHKLAVPRTIDQFERKRCQMNRKDVDYKLQWEFHQK